MPNRARLMRAAKLQAIRRGQPKPIAGEGPGGSASRPTSRSAKRPVKAKPAFVPPKPDIEAGKVRLQRVLADAGVASRRACEDLITGGHVEVNGEVIRTLPAFVDPFSDRIVVDGRPIVRRRTVAPAGASETGDGGYSLTGQLFYVMLYKPERVLTTLYDEGGRPTIADLIKLPIPVRLYPVGRLDFHAGGLVLLTNDGDMAHRLTHASFGVTKSYDVTVRGTIHDEVIEHLNQKLGVSRETLATVERIKTEISSLGPNSQRKRTELEATKPALPAVVIERARGVARGASEAQLREFGTAKTVIRITVSHAKRVRLGDAMAWLGLKVAKVVQSKLGPLELKSLGLGQWRELERDEVRALRIATGLIDKSGKGAGRGKGEPSTPSLKPDARAERLKVREMPQGPKPKAQHAEAPEFDDVEDEV